MKTAEMEPDGHRNGRRIPVRGSSQDPRRPVEAVRRGMGEPDARGEDLPPEEPAFDASTEADVEEPVPSPEEYGNLLEDYRRLAAEFDNYRKRQARDFNRLIHQGRKQLVTELLAVLDNFDRARDTLNGDHPDAEIITGLLQIGSQLEALLQKEGLSQVEAGEGDPFDPNIHEAMIAEEDGESPSDRLKQILQKGYRYGQELIRPVRVVVSRGMKREDTGPGE